jgi:hypothetical protein
MRKPDEPDTLKKAGCKVGGGRLGGRVLIIQTISNLQELQFLKKQNL